MMAWRQAIIWNSAGILLIQALGIKLTETLSKIQAFSFKKMHLKMSAKWHQFCLSLSVLIHRGLNKVMAFCWLYFHVHFFLGSFLCYD